MVLGHDNGHDPICNICGENVSANTSWLCGVTHICSTCLGVECGSVNHGMSIWCCGSCENANISSLLKNIMPRLQKYRKTYQR